ncbi:MAG: Fic family protein [Nitrospinales bacterium]
MPELVKSNPDQPYELKPLPPPNDFESKPTLRALINTIQEVSELKGYCSKVPNPRILLSITMMKESVESSEIEEIHTTVESVLKSQVIKESERRGPDKETLRYREALDWGFNNLGQWGLSTRLILGIHKVLMKSNVGYRKQQNAIKNTGAGDIIYTPPIASKINELIQNWENFVNHPEASKIHPLVRCAIAHYQFEAIHPFSDGNGRVGRILLALQFVTEKLLDFPVLFTSTYFNENRADYYRTLNKVTRSNDWENYVLFALEGFRVQAGETKKKLFTMIEIYEDLIKRIREDHSKIKAVETADHLFTYPFTNATYFSKGLGIHYTTAQRHLAGLKDSNILRDFWVGKRHLYFFPEITKII